MKALIPAKVIRRSRDLNRKNSLSVRWTFRYLFCYTADKSTDTRKLNRERFDLAILEMYFFQKVLHFDDTQLD